MMTTTIPNKAFDSEYSTQFKREMQYLKDHGFTYTFVKKTSDYHIPTYKYTKTPELFECIAAFYREIKNEKSYNKVKQDIDNMSTPFLDEVVNKEMMSYGA